MKIIKNQRKRVIFLSILCLAGLIFSFVINYPNVMNYDASVQLSQARSGVYEDWHPPFMAFIWHFIDKIYPGSLGMFILETALIWFGTFLIAVYWFDNAYPLLFSSAACLILFYPPIYGVSGVIRKDIFMWGCLMPAIGIIGAIKPFSVATPCRGIAKLALGSCFLFLALSFRYNAFFAVLPLIALGVMRSVGEDYSIRRLAATGAIGVVAFVVLVLGAIFVNSALTSVKNRPWVQLAFFDIAGVIHGMTDKEQQKELYARIPARARGNGSLVNLFFIYSPEKWDLLEHAKMPVFNPDPSKQDVLSGKAVYPTDQDYKVLMQVWFETIGQHPYLWFQHRLNVFKYMIGITQRDLMFMTIVESNGYPDEVMSTDSKPKQTPFQKSVKTFLFHLLPPVLFQPWFYLVLTIALLGACLAFRSFERIQIGIIATSGLAYESGLFFVTPATDFRYSHYMIYISVLALLLFLQTLFSKRDDTAG